MKTLCIIPCGARKIWDDNPGVGPTEAQRVYTGPFASKCREYAKKFYPESWCILSAKYGFLFPKDIVPEAYNVCFYDKKSNPITAAELLKQAKDKNMNEYDRFVILGGKTYVAMVNRVFGSRIIYTPLQGCNGLGYMMQRMNEAIKSGIAI
jgi:hypothetical protein